MVNPPKPADISYDQFLRESKAILGSLRKRAQIMTDGFNSCRNVVCNFTKGAMYSFPQIRLPPKVVEAVKTVGKVPDVFYYLKLLEATCISTVPGSGFGQKDGVFHLRTTILPAEEDMPGIMASFKKFNDQFMEQYEEYRGYSRIQPPIRQPKLAIKQDDTTSCWWNSHGLSAKLVLCCSALTIAEKETVSEFEMLSGVKVLKNWDSSVTHIIASIDENRACRRTLKESGYLNIEWVKACLKAKENVGEQRYEIDIDIYGIRGGPRLGRLRLLNKQPKFFDGYKFYFIGDF